MKRITHLLLLLLLFKIRHLARAQEISALSELPLNELLEQKKIVESASLTGNMSIALALVGESQEKEISSKGLHELPRRKTFYEEDYEDEKGHVYKKKDDNNIQDILNTSIMALSYLAFGGYLLCMIANALREKKRRIMMAYPYTGSATNHQFAHVLHNYVSQRPVRPFIRFPAVTIHQGKKKRRRRSNQRKATWEEINEDLSVIDIIDFIESLALDSN